VPGFLSSRPNWVPHPLTRKRVLPPPPFGSRGEGHTRLRERGRGEPFWTRGQTLWFSFRPCFRYFLVLGSYYCKPDMSTSVKNGINSEPFQYLLQTTVQYALMLSSLLSIVHFLKVFCHFTNQFSFCRCAIGSKDLHSFYYLNKRS
jgi:hypothetical protein